MYAFGLNLFRYLGVLEGAYNLLQLGRFNIEICRCGPNRCALGVEDGCLVNITSADKAGGQSAPGSGWQDMPSMRGVGWNVIIPGIDICWRRKRSAKFQRCS